ncbi:MAG: aminotransferase class I/II-fold pyridoxal phosphate-dependent enzyme [Bacteroidia bacterium]|nr:aminotransferase class I/II-fold pyridoxal phosphate-dependent enzyme [Bacteroidia bacterium]
MSNKHHFETRAIRQQSEKSGNREHSVPLYLTSSFTFEDAESMQATFAGETEGNIYSRYSNPNNDELISKVCSMEGAESGFAVTSGMSALFYALIPFLKAGDHLIASRALFGSTHQMLTQIFPRWNIDFTYVDGHDAGDWEYALQENTRILLLETPSNPGIAVIDLEKAGAFTKKHNLLFIVDNCFATPYIQRPIDWGADLVTHSATKFMDGQGRILGGLIVGKENLMEEVIFFARHTGPVMSSFNAWLLSKSLETLAIRMDRHCSNAFTLAQFLEVHKSVNKVNYPFLPCHPQYEVARKQMKLGGGVLSFEIDGGQSAAQNFKNKLKMITITSNLGDTRTIATHPSTSTHSKLTPEERAQVGITDGLIRISVGLEHIDDIIADIEQALP